MATTWRRVQVEGVFSVPGRGSRADGDAGLRIRASRGEAEEAMLPSASEAAEFASFAPASGSVAVRPSMGACEGEDGRPVSSAVEFSWPRSTLQRRTARKTCPQAMQRGRQAGLGTAPSVDGVLLHI